MKALTKLQILSARKNYHDLEQFKLYNRVRSEHVFISVDEALAYLDAVMYGKRINPNNIFDQFNRSTFLDADLFLCVNIIDEALVSIIYEIYQLNRNKAYGDINIIQQKLLAFSNFDLSNPDIFKVFPLDSLALLQKIILIIASMCVPTFLKPVESTELAYWYYKLFLGLYTILHRINSSKYTKNMIMNYTNLCLRTKSNVQQIEAY